MNYFFTFLIVLLSTFLKGECIPHDQIGLNTDYKRITDSGVVLVVGEPTGLAFGEGNTYKCKELPEEKKKVLGEETFVKKITQGLTRIRNRPATVWNNEVDEYFIFYSKEVWECSTKITRNTKTAIAGSFLRFHTTLISIKEIGGIEYFDSVAISSVTYIGNKTIVKIEEWKYAKYHKDSHHVLVPFTFEGFLDLEESDRSSVAFYPNKIGNLYPTFKMPTSEENKRIEYLRTLLNLPPSFKIIQTDARNGAITLFIDTPEKLVQFTGTGICQKLQGVDNPLPHHFKPQLYEYDIINKNRVKFSEKRFSKHFTIVKSVVWKCTAGIEGFYQIENEVVSAGPVLEVIFSDQVQLDYVHSIRLPETKGNCIRFKETKQFDILTGRPVHFNGGLTYMPVYGFYSSFGNIPHGSDIFYRLSAKAVYRTFISSNGYDLRIGSRIEESIRGISTANCYGVENYDSLNAKGALNTKLKVKANRNDMIHIMKPLNAKYFKIISKEVWECQTSSRKFLRVVNKLNILVPVQYLETFDGIEIFYVTLPGNEEKSVKIFEIKYLDFDNPSKVVSFAGKLMFDENSKRSIRMTKAETYSAVKKSTSETVPFIGSNYDSRSLLMRDYDPIIYAAKTPSPQTFVYSRSILNDKIPRVEFNASISIKTSITENEVIECEFICDKKKVPPVDITIIKKEKNGNISVTHSNLGMHDYEEQSGYINSKVSEVWECKLPNQVEPILRIVNRLQLDYRITVSLTYNPNVDTVWVESNGWGEEIIKMEDIRYLDQTNQQLIYLNARIALGEKKEFGNWISGTRSAKDIIRYLSRDATAVKKTFDDGLMAALRNWTQPGNQQSTVGNEIRKITYSGKNFHTMTIENGPRMFQIGSHWEIELPVEGTPMHCKIAPSNIFGNYVYIPKVMEYIDGKMHLLDEETLMDAFTIQVRKVWLCSYGKEKVIRLFTALCAKEPILALRYPDGVEVEKFPIYSGGSVRVIETIYIHVVTRKILKYAGTPYTTSNEIESAPSCPRVVESSYHGSFTKSYLRKNGY